MVAIVVGVVLAANLGYYAITGFFGPYAVWLALGVVAGAVAGRLGKVVHPALGAAGFLALGATELSGLHVVVAGLHLT